MDDSLERYLDGQSQNVNTDALATLQDAKMPTDHAQGDTSSPTCYHYVCTTSYLSPRPAETSRAHLVKDKRGGCAPKSCGSAPAIAITEHQAFNT